MSDVISAWVDRDEMRRLAESLLSQPVTSWSQRFEVEYGSEFEGFANDRTEVAPQKAAEAPEPMEPPTQPLPAEKPATLEKTPKAVVVVPSLPAPIPEEVVEAKEENPTPEPIVKTALSSLKRAQVEGMAGGVIRSSSLSHKKKESSGTPPALPTEESAAKAAKPILPSPFRRVNAVERPAVAAVATSPRKLVRPPTPSGDDPILARVHHFGKWLKGPVGVRKFFITNTEGKILLDEVENPKLIQVARSLTSAAANSSEGDGLGGSLHVRIGEDSILEVVPTPSQFGTLILGLIMRRSLPGESVREVRLGLQEVADARLIRARKGR